MHHEGMSPRQKDKPNSDPTEKNSLKSTHSKEPATAMFETSPWSPGERIAAPARTIKVEITQDHLEEARWRQFQDPVSIALREHLQENACAQVFWNSDSFAPQDSRDEARIGIYIENKDPENGQSTEDQYHLPLPRRATRAMWKIRSQGASAFKPFTTHVTLPAQALADATQI